jgi:hypothetical protein
MELTQYMDKFLGGEGAGFSLEVPTRRAGPTIDKVAKFVRPVSRSLRATGFWQAFIDSPSFEKTVGPAVMSVRTERFLVCHGSDSSRLDLLVFNPDHDASEPIVTRAEPQRGDLVEGAHRFWERTGASREYQYLMEHAVLRSSAGPQNFGIVVTAPPRRRLTRCPSPPWTVEPIGSSDAAGGPSTAGVVARNNQNQIGVTAALHALESAKSVRVKGQPGNVVSQDNISDSCFIALEDCPIPPTRGLAGPLRGLTPRFLDPVRFEGIGSREAGTFVIGWSPDLPCVLPYSQLKVLTKPDTVPGDSGAALIDTGDHILGFAFYRTGFGELIEFATWIWADSVFSAHHLNMI